ncbi:hypothetical protein ES706_02024 [subsurface metagenome]
MNWIGILVGIIGVAIAIYFGIASRRRRELVYSVNSVRTRVVISGQTKDLDVFYDGSSLGDVDITAVQLAFWNAGNESIRKPNILEEVVVKTEPPVRILEASIRAQSRNIVGLSLLDSPNSRKIGQVPISWDILERNDGASIQLLYLGEPEVDVSVQGVIEGQREIKRLSVSTDFKSPQDQKKSFRKSVLIATVCFIILLISMALLFFRKLDPDYIAIVFSGSVMIFLISTLNAISKKREKYPPFGF